MTGVQTCALPIYSSGSVKVQAVVRRLTAFVGRLHKDTTVEDLKALMSAAGLQKPHCYKLKNKDVREFRTSTFQVSRSILSRDTFYDEATWPEGCELRDWIFCKK